MPSPFPGMDPYIEGDLWTPFHTQIGVEIARQLAPKIAPRYVAIPEKRFVRKEPHVLDRQAFFRGHCIGARRQQQNSYEQHD